MNDEKKPVLKKPFISPVQISKAPPPITPLHGGYTRPRNSEKRPANWELWASIPHCKPRQAVALSLDLEPPADSHEVRGWPPEYERRLKITDAHIECRNLARSKADFHSVDLAAFSAWAQSLGWSLPSSFPRAADAPAAKVEAGAVTSPSGDGKPWLVANPTDPAPDYPWYTPARYFARQLVKADSTLLVKKNKLAEKTAASLAGVGEFKRGKKKEPLSAGTVLKSFVNVTLN